MTMNPSRHWPFFAALVIFAVLFAKSLSAAAGYTLGELVYALDDPYIHMAIARSLAEHWVWGLDGVHFAAASSSLLWPPLVALFFVLQGVNDFAPLVLNVLAAVALLAVAHTFLVRRGVKEWIIFLVLLFLIGATPLVPLSITGMEHVLHAFMAVAFLAVWTETLTAPTDRRLPPLLVVAALLLGAVRYEGLFEVGLGALYLFATRRRGLALLILAAAVLPATIYAVASMAIGWHALPNSVLLKGDQPPGYSPVILFSYFLWRLKLAWANPAVFAPMVAVVAFLAMRHHLRPGARAAAWLFMGTALVHVTLASYGWFFRYEAYLVALGLVALGGLAASTHDAADRTPSRWPAVLILLGLCSYPLVERTIASHRMAPLASKNIFDQQIQMAHFLAKYYPGRSVAANDIGAVGYYGGVKLLDLWGLADLEVANRKLTGTYNADAIRKIASDHGVEIAVVYSSRFHDKLPPEWIEVARWKITPLVVAGDDVVSFYALSTTGVTELLTALQEFQPNLPRDVKVGYRSPVPTPPDHGAGKTR